ncbi:biotin/lipoyl-containing protein, partial [Thiolapillus sp.]
MSTEIRVPTLPESVTDATVLSWHKQPGDSVRRDENILDLETDKVVLEVPSPVDGTLVELRASEGDLVEADDVLAVIEPGKPAARKPSPAPDQPTTRESSVASQEPVLTPAVRRLVRELKLDPRQITGTGKDGRILKSDVMTYLDQQTSSKD